MILDDWITGAPDHGYEEPDEIGRCCICGSTIHEGDPHYEIDGDLICEPDICIFKYIERKGWAKE
jgi:hypothetical protein